jgi:hypothetical protein
MEEGGEKEHPIPQSQVPYPEHLVGRESLAAIADIAAEFTGEADFRTLAEDETALAARVQQTLLNVDVFVARGKKEVRKPTDVVVAPRRRNPRTVRSDVIPIIGSSPRIVEQESATAAQETKERITDELIHERTRIASALQGMIQRREQSARSPQLQRIAGLLQGLVGRKEDDEEYYASLAPWMARIARSIDQMIDRERGSMYARERKKPEQNQAATQFSLPSLFEQTGEEERELHAETVFARIHGDERMREATRKRALRNIPHDDSLDGSIHIYP